MSEMRGESEAERRGEAARGRGEVGTSEEPPRMERASLWKKACLEREDGRWRAVARGMAVAVRMREKSNLMVAYEV